MELRSGLFRCKEQNHKIIINRKKIGEKVEELTGKKKFQTVLTYFTICENCDKLYTTESYEYIEDEKRVRNRCKDSEIGTHKIAGCGHESESDITKGLGKLAWKVEFAARWSAFDTRFEAYGKDIMDSVKVNDWVSDEILNFSHPHHIKYEMFLDKGGKKISKSLGNVVTSQKWLQFGTPQSILLLLYKRITGARELGFEDIPSLMNEYTELEKIYFGKIKIENEAKLICQAAPAWDRLEAVLVHPGFELQGRDIFQGGVTPHSAVATATLIPSLSKWFRSTPSACASRTTFSK